MKPLRCIVVPLLLLLLYGCAYYDPLVLESADALPAMKASMSMNAGITDNLVTRFAAEDDTLWTYAQDLINAHKYGFALRPKFKLGLGNNFEMAVSGNITTVTDSVLGDLFDLLSIEGDLGYMAKISLKKVWNLDNGLDIAVLPTYAIHYGAYKSEINADHAQVWLGGNARSWDLPIILSRKNAFGKTELTGSFILRPGYTLLNRDLRYVEYMYGHLHGDIVLNVSSDLGDAEITRLTLLYGIQNKAYMRNHYLELGVELVMVDKKALIMPVVGFSIEVNFDNLGKTH